MKLIAKTIAVALVLFTFKTQAQKPNVWTFTDMTNKTIPGNNHRRTINDPDDHSAMAGYLLMANMFNTKGIVVGSTNHPAHKTTPNQGDRANQYWKPAYEKEVENSESELTKGRDLIWSTRKVESGQSIHVVYEGPALKSMQRVHGQVKAWDNKNKATDWSTPAFWEIGVLDPALLLLPPALSTGEADLREQAEASLQKAVTFFHSINTQGGYGYYVTPDLSLRWGESPLDTETIEVQPPGTPAVGQSFLRAYQATEDQQALSAAQDAAYALIRGQNTHGGWDHTINFADLSNETVSFDDDQTQSAVSFLMALDRESDDPRLAAATKRALEMMITTQLDNGGWPHKYPARGNYHDFATFNDGGINDCIRVMIEAYQWYGEEPAIEKSLRRAVRFMMISQLPPPQPGWAQQYNEFLQPAWARSFEPPSVCPAVTIKNINTLIDLYLVLGEESLLEPIPDALRWLDEVRMENGKWARFAELGTNKALYYDRGRIRVASVAELHPERRTGYAYETDLEFPLEAGRTLYEKALELGYQGLRQDENQRSQEEVTQRLKALSGSVKKILEKQESSGAWITRDDRFKQTMPKGVRWNGEYTVMDRISSAVFNQNVAILCEYIELSRHLD